MTGRRETGADAERRKINPRPGVAVIVCDRHGRILMHNPRALMEQAREKARRGRDKRCRR